METVSQQSVSDLAVDKINVNSICHYLYEHLPEGKLASHSRQAYQKLSTYTSRKGHGSSNSNGNHLCGEVCRS